MTTDKQLEREEKYSYIGMRISGRLLQLKRFNRLSIEKMVSKEITDWLKSHDDRIRQEERERIKKGYWKTLSKRSYADETGAELDISNCLIFEKDEDWGTIWKEIIKNSSTEK